jgi:predicted acylesterase/phospholipase RssA/CRP-like cAMP-binding protein
MDSKMEVGLRERLASVGLFRGLDESSHQALASEASLVERAPGETLFRQGDDANSVFVLLEGRLSVLLDREKEGERLLTELRSGDIVGDVALVARGQRSATVRVVEPSTLAELPVETLNRLLGTSPEISARVVELVSRRLRRSQLATHLTNLFGGFGADTLAEVERAIEWISLPAGDVLYQEGDPGDAAYLVVSGRLRVLAFDPEERLVEEIGRGDMVGELSLVEDSPRAFSVFAARDTDLARLPRSSFEKLLERHPLAMLGVARTVFRRSRAPAPELRRRLGEGLSIGVIPAAPGVDLGDFVAELADALSAHGGTVRLDPQRVDAMLDKPGIANSVATEPAHIRLVQWIHEIEDQHRFVIYEADPTWTRWSDRAIRQADFLMTVGDARGVQPPGDTERLVEANRKSRHPRWSLVLLHEPETARPTGTSRWLEQRNVESVHHVRRRKRSDVARLARFLAGRTVGVVFGGGGARGFAHLGVLRALEELGVPVDMVGGTSIGATMAACPATGRTAAEALEDARTAFNSILDYTLPIVAVMSGNKITRSIERFLGEWDIEDLWLPYFCVSTNITRAGPVIHRRGSLAHAVRASVAIPGVLPPVPDGEDLLVDGGVLNNLPIDVMREQNPTGPLIAVDVVPPHGPAAKSDYGLSVSGWQVATNQLLPWRSGLQVPSIGGTMLRSMLVGADSTRQRLLRDGLADLYLSIRMGGVGMLAFDDIESVQKIGYEQGLDALRKWIDGGGME